MKTVDDLKLCDFISGDNGEVLKVCALVDHPESDLLRRVGFKDMTFTQRDVFSTLDLPRTQTVNAVDYTSRKVGRPRLESF